MITRVLSRDEHYAMERAADERFGIPPIILMENAGRVSAEIVDSLPERLAGPIVVCAGRGNNGGDGLVCARYLFNRAQPVTVVLAGSPEKYREPAFTNWEILRKMGIASAAFSTAESAGILRNAGVIVDALFGIGLREPIRGTEAELIALINECPAPTVSLDVPSGLDADTGRVLGRAVRAEVTVSFGFAKRGFTLEQGPELCGRITIADIGYPRHCYEAASTQTL